MRKIAVFMILLLVLTPVAFADPFTDWFRGLFDITGKITKTSGCTDSDGGRNYNTIGTAKIGTKQYVDYCKDSKYIFEYDCGENGGIPFQDGCGHNGFGGCSYLCPNGCKNGACVDVILTVPKISGAPLGELSVPVTINSDKNVTSYEIHVIYNTNKLELNEEEGIIPKGDDYRGSSGYDFYDNLYGWGYTRSFSGKTYGKQFNYVTQNLAPGKKLIKIMLWQINSIYPGSKAENGEIFKLNFKVLSPLLDEDLEFRDIIFLEREYNKLTGFKDNELTYNVGWIERPTCTDSDGRDYYTKGTVSGVEGVVSDVCMLSSWDENRYFWDNKFVDSCGANTNNNFYSDNNPTGSKDDRCSVFEYICPNKGEYPILGPGEVYYCLYGCKDGACIKGATSSTTNIPNTNTNVKVVKIDKAKRTVDIQVINQPKQTLYVNNDRVIGGLRIRVLSISSDGNCARLKVSNVEANYCLNK